MERPLISLSAKDFFTGIASSYHSGRDGLFATGSGVTAVYDPGGKASTENGLLQAGPAPTNIGGSTVDDVIWAADSGYVNVASRAFFYGADGNIYQLLANGTFSEIKTGISSPKAGIKVWRNGLYYWNNADVGRSTDLSTFNDSAISPSGLAANIPAPHIFYDRLYYFHNAGIRLDRLTDVTTNQEDVLDFEAGLIGTGISDDGVYLVLSFTTNEAGADIFAVNKILFWDTVSSSWQREYVIYDPFIWSLKRVGNVVIAFGQKGIYEVSFDGGVKKLTSNLLAFGTPADVITGYGFYRADIYNQQALIFGTDAEIETFGKLDSSLPSAHIKPFKVPTSVGTPTCVFTKFAFGAVYVATDGGKLYRYDFDGSTRETGVSAQTVYLPLRSKTSIHRIDVIFGEPLVSGDAMSIQMKTDEDTSATPTTAYVASYANDGAARRKSIPILDFVAESSLSLLVNFTTGAVKIKRIDIYGKEETEK